GQRHAGPRRDDMGLAAKIKLHVPFLRRFARALTGSQTAGDAYVATLLEALIAEPGMIDDLPSNLRVSLYRAFCRLWGSVRLNLETESESSPEHSQSPPWVEAAQNHLSAIPPRAREAFVLM